MNRRDFIKHVVPATTLPFLLNGFRVHAFGESRFLKKLFGESSETDRVLVLIQLSGGNDGINTVIPLDHYSAYHNVRSNIAIPKTSVLRLSNATGIHPAMTGFKRLFDNGRLAVVQGVTYPNPNFSHFRATDIWLTASNYDEYLTSGWLGRYFDQEFPGYPANYPNQIMPDPLAIQIGSVLSLGLQGSGHTTGIAVQDPQTFFQLVSGYGGGGSDTPPQTPAGHELTYVRQVILSSQAYAGAVKGAADKVQNKATYPTPNTLADQLKIVARLIAGGLKTRVYIVGLGGFDHHANQVDADNTTLGAHATLLACLSSASLAFQSDLNVLGIDNRVITMTFSEFGRRVASNGSLGTDHGTAEPVFLFGKMVKGGFFGSNPSMTNLDNGNLKMQFDFRQVYASIVSKWFGVGQAELSAVMLRQFHSLRLI